MSGEFELEGEVTFGQALPIGLAASAAISASVGLVLPQISAQIEGLIELSTRLTITPPSLAVNLESAFALVAALQASIELGVPSIDFQLAAVAELLASLQLSLGALNAQLAFSASLDLLFGTGGVLMYAYTGTADGIVDAAQSAFASLPGVDPATNVGGVFLIATTPGAATAMDLIFA
jgi:hypothetical protein